MPASPNQKDTALPDMPALLLSIERHVKRAAIGFVMGVSERFVGYQISGEKKLSLTHFLKLWTSADADVTDPIASFLETQNPAYSVSRRSVDAAEDPEAKASNVFRRGADFLDAVRESRKDRGIDREELARIKSTAEQLCREIGEAVEGCAKEHRAGRCRR